MQRDLAMPTNLKDPKSRPDLLPGDDAVGYSDGSPGRPIANLPKIPFFENFWAKAAGNGLTPTQVVAQDYLYNSNPGDFTNVLDRHR